MAYGLNHGLWLMARGNDSAPSADVMVKPIDVFLLRWDAIIERLLDMCEDGSLKSRPQVVAWRYTQRSTCSDCPSTGCTVADCTVTDCTVTDRTVTDCTVTSCTVTDCTVADCTVTDCTVTDCKVAECTVTDCTVTVQ